MENCIRKFGKLGYMHISLENEGAVGAEALNPTHRVKTLLRKTW